MRYVIYNGCAFLLMVTMVASGANAFGGMLGPPADEPPIVSMVPNDSQHPALPAFKPAEIYNIDSKVDDGMPGTGQMVVYGADPSSVISSCTTAADSTAASAATAKYLVSNDTKKCASVFRKQF